MDEIHLGAPFDANKSPDRQWLLLMADRTDLSLHDRVGVGALLLAHAECQAACAVLRAAAVMTDTAGSGPDGYALYNLGICEALLGRFADAVTALRDAAMQFREVNDGSGWLLAVANGAACSLELGDHGAVVEGVGAYLCALERGLVDAEPATVDRSLLSLCYSFAASASQHLGHLQAAEEYFASAITVADASDSAALANMHQNLGAVLNQAGKFEDALRVHEIAIALHTTDRNDAGHANSLENYGFAAAQQNLLPEALHAWRTALGLWQQLGRPEREAALHEKLGTLHLYRDHVSESVAAFQLAVTMALNLGLSELQAVAQEKLDNVWGVLMAEANESATATTLVVVPVVEPIALPALKAVGFQEDPPVSDSLSLAVGPDGRATHDSSSSDSSDDDGDQFAVAPPAAGVDSAQNQRTRLCVMQ